MTCSRRPASMSAGRRQRPNRPSSNPTRRARSSWRAHAFSGCASGSVKYWRRPPLGKRCRRLRSSTSTASAVCARGGSSSAPMATYADARTAAAPTGCSPRTPLGDGDRRGGRRASPRLPGAVVRDVLPAHTRAPDLVLGALRNPRSGCSSPCDEGEASRSSVVTGFEIQSPPRLRRAPWGTCV
jgi:hypothetical protein